MAKRKKKSDPAAPKLVRATATGHAGGAVRYPGDTFYVAPDAKASWYEAVDPQPAAATTKPTRAAEPTGTTEPKPSDAAPTPLPSAGDGSQGPTAAEPSTADESPAAETTAEENQPPAQAPTTPAPAPTVEL